MSESIYIDDASFSNIIGEYREYPYSLFQRYKGGLYTPKNKVTLFQDATMLVPVQNVGDPVKVISDQSGNGNHFVCPSSSGLPTYQEVNGSGVVRFSGAQRGYVLSGSSLEMFAGAQQGLVLFSSRLPSISTYRTAFRVNVSGGNVTMLGLETSDPATNLNVIARRTATDVDTVNTYVRSANKDLFTMDVDWATGRYDTYRNSSEKQSKVIPSTGMVPPSVANGIYLGEFNNTRYAQMDFSGLIMLAGAGPLTLERAALEAWMVANT